MKEDFRSGVVVSVREARWEAPPETAALYQGIYEMRLNHRIAVTFVPAVDLPRGDMVLPADFDAITSVAEARLIWLAGGRYSVTPDPERAGTSELGTWFDWPENPPVVFFVGPAAFDRFERELGDLTGEFAGIHDTKPLADLADREVVRFVERQILASPNLSPEDREVLARGREGTGP